MCTYLSFFSDISLHVLQRKRQEKTRDQMGVCVMTLFFIFPKRFSNGNSKRKTKINDFFKKKMKGVAFILDLFNIYFYLEVCSIFSSCYMLLC